MRVENFLWQRDKGNVGIYVVGHISYLFSSVILLLFIFYMFNSIYIYISGVNRFCEIELDLKSIF